MVKFPFENSEMYNFTIETETVERKNDDGKIEHIKLKYAHYKNPDILNVDMYRMHNDNAPEVLRGIEYFVAPFPFYKFKYQKINEGYYPRWTVGGDITAALIAFKHGYIDGFYSRQGMFIGNFTVGIIVVDPIKRLEVRKFFAEEYKELLDKVSLESCFYCIVGDTGSLLEKHLIDAKLPNGTVVRRPSTLEERIKDITEWFNNPSVKGELTDEEVKKHIDVMAHELFYDLWYPFNETDEHVFKFNSYEDAVALINEHEKWLVEGVTFSKNNRPVWSVAVCDPKIMYEIRQDRWRKNA